MKRRGFLGLLTALPVAGLANTAGLSQLGNFNRAPPTALGAVDVHTHSRISPSDAQIDYDNPHTTTKSQLGRGMGRYYSESIFGV